MELKYYRNILKSGSYESSNRTFMELKFPTPCPSELSRIVLIAPLWNWNWNKDVPPHPRFLGSNRTFMELKYFSYHKKTRDYFVLIAPLWNWNWCFRYSVIRKIQVLIAPLWNWNVSRPGSSCRRPRSNRTFMELKYGFQLLAGIRICVLIAPLWNWNEEPGLSGNPLARSNRTFMELK